MVKDTLTKPVEGIPVGKNRKHQIETALRK